MCQQNGKHGKCQTKYGRYILKDSSETNKPDIRRNVQDLSECVNIVIEMSVVDFRPALE